MVKDLFGLFFVIVFGAVFVYIYFEINHYMKILEEEEKALSLMKMLKKHEETAVDYETFQD